MAWETEEVYNNSYVNIWLNNDFYNSLESRVQDNILDSTFNIGIHADVDEITTVKKVGLLDMGLFPKLGGINSYINNNNNYWLGNRMNSSNIMIFNMEPKGIVSTTTSGVRPIIKIKDLTIAQGDSSATSNYITKE